MTLAPRPGATWGRAPEARPGRRWRPAAVVPAAPFLRAEADRFRDRLVVELASADAAAEIRYRRVTADDGEPWSAYEGPIEIGESTRLRFFATVDERRSPTVETRLHRLPNDWTVELASVPNPQYTAEGPLALIDGLRGDANWRTGGWMGFQYTDFSATVDLREPRPVRRAGASFLQDQRSWIWMPSEVVVSVSDDGVEFREVARLSTDVAEDADGVVLRDVVVEPDTPPVVRHVRIDARSLGTIPDWHPGRGDGAFVFVDELIVE